ncbi:HORMA-1 domain-containing protein [Asticcacaulis taihuensis]|uniref:HORMA-1 domain-containing protein n=1 Tax=Asticcacaulis taihuensis TaxID=260084 RepID=UPI003F7B5227
MSFSYSVTETNTFTVTHARHMAAKVATDLKRIQRLYGEPSDSDIASYEAEITEFIRAGYLSSVTYGFKRNGNWIEPTLKYTAQDLAGTATDDDPGRIRAGGDTTGAVFSSFLSYSGAWFLASDTQKSSFESGLPFSRSSGSEPGVTGYLTNDKTYSAGGRALNRFTVRSF